MNTYSWRIMSMDVRPQIDAYSDLVMRAQWELTVTDSVVGDTAGTQGYTQFSIPAQNFIPYQDLTESQVISWVHDVIGTSQIAELEAFVNNLLITNRLPPITQLPLPWVT